MPQIKISMNILFEIGLIILIWILGSLFWNVIKVSRLKKQILSDQNAIDQLVKNFFQYKLFEKKAEEISAIGKKYSNRYDLNLFLEIKSSKLAFDKTRK